MVKDWVESNTVYNHRSDNKSDSRFAGVNDSYDYRPNWTPLVPITIINHKKLQFPRKEE